MKTVHLVKWHFLLRETCLFLGGLDLHYFFKRVYFPSGFLQTVIDELQVKINRESNPRPYKIQVEALTSELSRTYGEQGYFDILSLAGMAGHVSHIGT